jgi:hypothetical protein
VIISCLDTFSSSCWETKIGRCGGLPHGVNPRETARAAALQWPSECEYVRQFSRGRRQYLKNSRC